MRVLMRPSWLHDVDDRGQGGIEVLPLALLVLVVGVLVVAHAWAVIDAKTAVEAASRQAARAYVEADDEASALRRGEQAALETLRGAGRDDGNRVRIEAPPAGSFARCARIAWSVEYDVPLLALPWVGRAGRGVVTARATHSEVVDPYRSGPPVDAAAGVRCGS